MGEVVGFAPGVDAVAGPEAGGGRVGEGGAFEEVVAGGAVLLRWWGIVSWSRGQSGRIVGVGDGERGTVPAFVYCWVALCIR